MREPAREALRWFLQAEDDLRFVEWVTREGIFFDKGCFIAQQAGEKALKACLYGVGMRKVIGHSLYEMTQELAKRDELFMVILPPLPLIKTADPQADIQRHLELQSRSLEAWVRTCPEQWLWFHRRWKNQFPEIYS